MTNTARSSKLVALGSIAIVGLTACGRVTPPQKPTLTPKPSLSSTISTVSPSPISSPINSKLPSASPITSAGQPSPTQAMQQIVPTPQIAPTQQTKTFVTAGAFCSSPGSIGYTKTGKMLTCKPSATDTRNRWR